MTWSISADILFKFLESASAWAVVRGKPSSIYPDLQSPSFNLFSIIPITTSSGTSPPASMYDFAFIPSWVLSATAFLKISPVDTCGILYFFVINFACVPLPAPGGPNKINRIFMPFCSSIFPSSQNPNSVSSPNVILPAPWYPLPLQQQSEDLFLQNKMDTMVQVESHLVMRHYE